MKRRIDKVQLVNAPVAGQIHSSGSASFYPHLGLLSIATHLLRAFPDIDVEIIDGSIVDLDSILSRLDADLVGISVLTPTYDTGIAIAQKAKELGAITVFGNDHATMRWRQILTRRPEVDFVICGDHGEVSLAMLVERLRTGEGLQDIPALALRAGEGIGVNRHVIPHGRHMGSAKMDGFDVNGFPRYRLESLAIPDRRLIDDEDVYFRNYALAYAKFHDKSVRQTTINIARGCAWGASDKRRCIFCDIYDLSERATAPAKAWEEVEQLVNLGYNFLYEVCDSFTSFALSSEGFLAKLLASRPATIPSDTEWFVYARASELARDGVVRRLADFGVRRLNLGIDSASDAVLRGMSKGAGKNVNYKAVEICAQNQIQMYVSFVFGSIGESKESLRETLNFVERSLETGYIVSVDPSVLLPLPNAPAWNYLIRPESASAICRRVGFAPRRRSQASYEDEDHLDTEKLSQDWVSTFCNCTYEDIIDARDHIVALQARHQFVFGGFGVRGF